LSSVAARRSWLALILSFAAVAAFAPSAMAQGEDTVWICKPGQADDLCAGTIEGTTMPPPGESPQPLGYTRPEDPPVDCFYLYPTQSPQETQNSNLDKDPPIRRVVVQQARMFSTVCDVYAPMYRQVTNNGNQISYNESVETAYQSAKAGFEDFLANYNGDRGFIMLGHSQGSAHTARLIDEMVDTDPELRKRFVGAIAPGANISVPIGEAVGGLFQNVPACTQAGEYGCVTAFSTFNDVPPPNARFSRLSFGYWIYPEPRPDASQFEVMCTNPALLDGGDGTLLPLVNFDYLSTAPPSESPAPWASEPDYYKAECKRQDGAHWLNLGKVGLPGDARPDLGAAVASGSDYHVPEVNLTEGNLLKVAQIQTDEYLTDRAKLEKKLEKAKSKLKKAKKRRAADRKKIAKLSDKLGEADGKRKRSLKRKIKTARSDAKVQSRKIKALKKKIAKVDAQLP
jgi:hypothetical protein